MNHTLTAHLGDLVETLRDLRHRLRQAARLEVARTIGEALREVALAMICGPARFASAASPSYTGWDDDPWRDPTSDPWSSHQPLREEAALDVPEPRSLLAFSPALMAGLGIARWSYLLTRRPGVAASLGILVTLAAHAGGPAVRSLLEALSVSQELLSFPGADRSR